MEFEQAKQINCMQLFINKKVLNKRFIQQILRQEQQYFEPFVSENQKNWK